MMKIDYIYKFWYGNKRIHTEKSIFDLDSAFKPNSLSFKNQNLLKHFIKPIQHFIDMFRVYGKLALAQEL